MPADNVNRNIVPCIFLVALFKAIVTKVYMVKKKKKKRGEVRHALLNDCQ